ncbi:MAG TPA: hypothetical protein VJ780_03765, partial [Flavobacterium sp.]|nr:hypothetical protein [Flavobacterium sp.]
MKKLIFAFSIISIIILSSIISCKKDKETKIVTPIIKKDKNAFRPTAIDSFFDQYPLLKNYEAEVKKLYQKHNYHYVWFDKNGRNEFANLLYDKINNLEEEGIQITVPYQEKLEQIHRDTTKNKKPNIETELLNSALYFLYTKHVYHGLDTKKSEEIEWYIPRKKASYISYLDSLLANPSLINNEEKNLIGQYHLLKKALKKYRKIQKNGGWNSITIDTAVKAYKIGDSAAAISEIRNRLFISGDISNNSGSSVYDRTLSKGILKYKERRGLLPSSIISTSLIKDLNIPI